MSVSLIPHAPLHAREGSAMPGRGIIDQPGPAWTGFALMEWELTGAQWTDRHPHDEVNYVLAGSLHVESEGHSVVAGPGDTVVVPAGGKACYTAPTYARMLAIYGPNPEGTESSDFEYRQLSESPVNR